MSLIVVQHSAVLCPLLERKLNNSNYERLTQSIKRKDKKNTNDASVIDATVQLDNKNDTDSDTIIDTDNDTLIKKVALNDHGPQSNYGDVNGIQLINYGDDNDKTDVSKSITSVNKLYKYQSYKDVCNGRTITHGSDTVTHDDTPTTTPQVTSE